MPGEFTTQGGRIFPSSRQARNDLIRRRQMRTEVAARGLLMCSLGRKAFPPLGGAWEELASVPGCTWAKQMGTLTTVRILEERSPRKLAALAALPQFSASTPNLPKSQAATSGAEEATTTIVTSGGAVRVPTPPVSSKGKDRVAGHDSALEARPRQASAPSGGQTWSGPFRGGARPTQRNFINKTLMSPAGEMGSFPLMSGYGNNRPMFHVNMPHPEG